MFNIIAKNNINTEVNAWAVDTFVDAIETGFMCEIGDNNSIPIYIVKF